MTSNIGAATISKNQTLGFSVGDEQGLSYDEMKTRITGELKKVFRPELLNRIDEVIVFHKLTKAEILTIVELLLRAAARADVDARGHDRADRRGEGAAGREGLRPDDGRPPVRRAIQRHIEDPLADFVLGRSLEPGSTILVARRPESEDVEITVIPGAPTPDMVTVPTRPRPTSSTPRTSAPRNVDGDPGSRAAVRRECWAAAPQLSQGSLCLRPAVAPTPFG